MGKRIITRARGKGGLQYRAPSHRYLGKVDYLHVEAAGKAAKGQATKGYATKEAVIKGVVKDILHDPGRSAPVAVTRFENVKEEVLHIASEGLEVGREIEYGGKPEIGNVLMLKDIPIGTRVLGLELTPNSGPKICRSAGSFATVLNKTDNKVTVQFSSGKIKDLNANCRATIGVPAGGGRSEKPFVKAGTQFYARAARGKLFPRPSGVHMSPVDHPYGGRSKRPRTSKTVSRNAPPGAKVGSIAARRTGIRKGVKK